MLLSEIDVIEIKKKCQNFKVKVLFLFGSAATDDYTTQSDIDFLVDFEDVSPELYLDYYYNFKEELIEYFQRKIDLLELKALKNPYLIDEIKKNRILLYGKAS
jgi:predicted nucleotidyltransferase